MSNSRVILVTGGTNIIETTLTYFLQPIKELDMKSSINLLNKDTLSIWVLETKSKVKKQRMWRSIQSLTTCRNKLGNKNVHFVQLDVTDQTSVNNAVKKIQSEQTHLDILVNNAGTHVRLSIFTFY